MKRIAFFFATVLVVSVAVAQPPEERGDRQGPGSEFRPPSDPLFEALDANGDGELSDDEMKNAFAALAKLDKNGDGKLTREEVRPQSASAAGSQSDPFQPFIARIMALDTNKDGRVSIDEAIGWQQSFSAADLNFDGSVDEEELRKAVPYLLSLYRQRPGAFRGEIPPDLPR